MQRIRPGVCSPEGGVELQVVNPFRFVGICEFDVDGGGAVLGD